MSILINEMKDKFTQIPNKLIEDSRLSHGAKMVYVYVASKPSGWVVYNRDIQKALNIKTSQTIANFWKELLESGWISRHKNKDESVAKVGVYMYTLYGDNDISTADTTVETTTTKPTTAKPSTPKPAVNNEQAEEVYESYKTEIKSSRSKQQAINNISSWLKEFTKEELILAIQNYSPIAKRQSEDKYKKEACNFFGTKGDNKGYFKDYIGNNELSYPFKDEDNDSCRAEFSHITDFGKELYTLTYPNGDTRSNIPKDFIKGM